MEKAINLKSVFYQLIFAGLVLLFLGLLTGVFASAFANPRMGLSSHIEGILNGLFLIAMGLIWHKLELKPRWLSIGFWLLIYGSYANWLATLLSGVFNAGKMFTIVPTGLNGSMFIEGVISFLLISLSLAMLLGVMIVMSGAYNGMKTKA
ncbi:MAG: hydrogenase [Bacteroidetes bacterium]|nr:hydrogenase [Bacteroidota bacterium]